MSNEKVKNILVSGSLVYDRIMDFPGYFKDHILPDKIHILNVAFAVNGMKENFGGTAGNIAYNLALLGERPVVLSRAGNDFGEYEKWFRKFTIDLSQVKKIKNSRTASAYIITDKSDNQITGFNSGALAAAGTNINKKLLKNSLAIVAPGNITDMEKYSFLYKKENVPYIFDPGQMITSLSKTTLKNCITGAEILIGNDYEMNIIEKNTGWTRKTLIGKVKMLIITKGEKGSELCNKKIALNIPAAKIKRNFDPTGAGDAYRAGLIKGLLNNWPLEKIGRFASVVASYAVENYGTQNHKFNWKELEVKYKKSYNEVL